MKSEPSCFSIDDLKRIKKSPWDGVRNYQARNFMRDDMKIGDLVLFYHSNAKPSGIVGLGKVASKPYPDPTAFDPNEGHFDPKSDPDNPTWILVDIAFEEKYPEILPLQELKKIPDLDGMLLLKKGCRLSVQPVEKKHFTHVQSLKKQKLFHGK
ncbi:MAG: hypothetical protein S4CHLAM123_10320 [Chlamydiales bacterium]|nr:hypothetical protein [Chlamydiales bacterium]